MLLTGREVSCVSLETTHQHIPAQLCCMEVSVPSFSLALDTVPGPLPRKAPVCTPQSSLTPESPHFRKARPDPCETHALPRCVFQVVWSPSEES